jgi:hypothetical protein
MVARAVRLTSRIRVVSILVFFICIGCSRLSPAEKRLVGEWKSMSIGGEMVMTIRADHTWTSVGGCLPDVGPVHGRWRVDGNDFIYETDQHQFPDAPKLKPLRVPIQQLVNDDRVVRSWADHRANK